MACSPYDYDCWKRTCNASGTYTPACLSFFLSLPRGDIGITSNRQDFASGVCSDIRNLSQPQCRVLCQDTPAVCRDFRTGLCRGITLDNVKNRIIPPNSILYQASLQDPSLLSLCGCYLESNQYEIALESIRQRLGSLIADQLRTAISFPQCFVAECASSDLGRDTQTAGCASVSACVQSISTGEDRAITSNVCIINSIASVADGAAPMQVMQSPWFWWLVVILVILVIVTIVVSVVRPRPKPPQLVPVFVP